MPTAWIACSGLRRLPGLAVEAMFCATWTEPGTSIHVGSAATNAATPPAASSAAAPREPRRRSGGTGEHERVEGLKGSDQGQPQQERAAAEERVRAGGVAGAVVVVDEQPVGVAQVQMGVFLAMAQQVVRPQHVHG